MVYVINGFVTTSPTYVPVLSDNQMHRYQAYYSETGYPPTWRKLLDETDVYALMKAVRETTSAVELATFKALTAVDTGIECARARTSKMVTELEAQIKSVQDELRSAERASVSKKEEIVENKWTTNHFPLENI